MKFTQREVGNIKSITFKFLNLWRYEQILCIKYKILCMLAHNRPQTRLQRQDTAQILECPKHFASSLHLISKKSPENITNLPCLTFSNAVAWLGVLYAHGTQWEMAVMAIPCAYDTPCQTNTFVNVIYGHCTIHTSDSVEVRCRNAEKCLATYEDINGILLCQRVCSPL